MSNQFEIDLANAKEAEKIVKDTLTALTADYTFIDVSNEPEYYHKGDIKAIDSSGKEFYLEVKDDSRIADTQRILCEEEVYYKNSDYTAIGNMYSDYEYYCIVSKQDRKIYILDFDVLKKIYRKYAVDFKKINHKSQYSWCYLLEMCRAKQLGALMYKLSY